MAKDCYAYYVKDTKENGLVFSWEECQKIVKGRNVTYKGFDDIEEAEDFLNKTIELNKEPEKDCDMFYVDGSFDEESNYYSYGLVYVKDKKIVYIENGKSNKAVEGRQTAGEMLGAIKALCYARLNGITDVKIGYDYEGIRSHAIGLWKTNKPASKQYKDWYDKFISSNPSIQVTFVKIAAHSGIYHNEIADELAKEALGMKGLYAEQLKKERESITKCP